MAFFVGALVYADTRSLTEALIHRGEALIQHTQHLLKEHRNHSLGHLVDTVEHELSLVEALIFSLKFEHSKENFTLKEHHLHLIEEDLLHIENRVAEELAVIEDTLNHEHLNQPADKLIAHAKALIEHAKQVAKNYGNSHNQKEIKAIEHEIHLIQKLISQLEQHPTGAELRKEEQTLVRNQQTLLHLIERVMAHDQHHHQQPEPTTAAPQHPHPTEPSHFGQH